MRPILFGVFACALIFASSTLAQIQSLTPPDPIPAPVRDVQAVVAVQNAINALGGTALIAQQQSWIVQGSVTGGPGGPTQSGAFAWEAAGSEYRFAGSNSTGKSLFVTGHGNPIQITGAESHAVPPQIARAMFVPALVGPILLQKLQNQSYSIRYGGMGTIGTRPVVIVSTAAETTYPENVVTPQTWYFDASTTLPARVEFRSPVPKYLWNYVTERLDFSDFRPIAGTVFPFLISFSVDGNEDALQTFSLNTISVNANIALSDFDAPSGGAL